MFTRQLMAFVAFSFFFSGCGRVIERGFGIFFFSSPLFFQMGIILIKRARIFLRELGVDRVVSPFWEEERTFVIDDTAVFSKLPSPSISLFLLLRVYAFRVPILFSNFFSPLSSKLRNVSSISSPKSSSDQYDVRWNDPSAS